jgi:hypothetical protein
MDPSELVKLVNASGFLFQWAVEEHVRATSGKHNWKVVAREYPWSTDDRSRGGYIDFVADRYGLYAVFECKRTRGGEWIFLVPPDAAPTLNMLTLWCYVTEEGENELGWGNLHFEPAMLRAEFCIVRGASDDDKPMLERIAGDLVRASESLARDEAKTKRRRSGSVAAFLPVVVTNARLYVCRVDPQQVDLATGVLPSTANFEEVTALKFQKATATDLRNSGDQRSIQEMLLTRERSVVVVNVEHLSEWLNSVSEKANGLSAPPRPWKHLETA